jgi:hypothetical protein
VEWAKIVPYFYHVFPMDGNHKLPHHNLKNVKWLFDGDTYYIL